MENERACFHTGLYNSRYKGIYAFFERNHKKDSMLDWYFRGFCDELSPWLRYIQPLPQKPSFYVTQKCAGFNPDWPVRANVEHILGDAEIWSGFQRRSARRRTCRYYLKQRWNWAEEGLWWNRGLWYLKDTRENTVPASGLSDKYEEARPCHDTGGDGRLLYGPYLPDFGDGLFKCQGDRKTAGSVADRISALGN